MNILPIARDSFALPSLLEGAGRKGRLAVLPTTAAHRTQAILK